MVLRRSCVVLLAWLACTAQAERPVASASAGRPRPAALVSAPVTLPRVQSGRAESPSAQVSAGAAFAKIRADLEQLVASGGVASVAVGVVHGGRIVWAEALGSADREAATPATIDTPYGIASMGKAMTATAVMTLVERGRLRLDTRVAHILGRDAVRVVAGTRGPTVRELLDMTAGIPHGAITYRIADHPGEADILHRQAVVVFPPGEVFHYSNFSIAVADAVVEAASGQSFGDYLRERVFSPLQMTHTSLGDVGSLPPPARRYDASGVPQVDARFPRSSRQVQSSLVDLLKFAAFQLGTPLPGQQPVLDAASLTSMQRQRSHAPGAHMALGIGSLDLGNGQRWILSSGNDIGVQSHLTLLPHAGIGVVVLLNSSGDHADELGIRIADTLDKGFAELTVAAIRGHEARTTTFKASKAWEGTWAGRVDALDGAELQLGITADGTIRAALGGRPAVVVEDAKYPGWRAHGGIHRPSPGR